MKTGLIAMLPGLPGTAGGPPEGGSERWCRHLNDRPKGDRTLDETRDYARNCAREQEDGN